MMNKPIKVRVRDRLGFSIRKIKNLESKRKRKPVNNIKRYLLKSLFKIRITVIVAVNIRRMISSKRNMFPEITTKPLNSYISAYNFLSFFKARVYRKHKAVIVPSVKFFNNLFFSVYNPYVDIVEGFSY